MDLKRSQDLFDAKLIAAQDFEAKKVTYELAVSTLLASQRRVQQARSAKPIGGTALLGANEGGPGECAGGPSK